MRFLRAVILAIGVMGLMTACGGSKKAADEPVPADEAVTEPAGDETPVDEAPVDEAPVDEDEADPCGGEEDPCGGV